MERDRRVDEPSEIDDGGRRRARVTPSLADAIGNAELAKLIVRRRALPTHDDGPLDPDVAAAIDAQRGAGAPLPASAREEMEPLFGADFSDVRVHTDDKAATLNRAVQAEAFTVGTDMFFATGAFAPSGQAGRRLLAHELTHVLQGDGSDANPPTNAITAPNDACEIEADRAADAVVSSLTPDAPTRTGAVAASAPLTRRLARAPVTTDTKSGEEVRAGPGRRLLGTGGQVGAIVARVMPSANTIVLDTSFGPVELRPGTIWGGNRMLVLAETMTVYYTIGDRLYEEPTGLFLRDQWFAAAGEGAQRAEGMVMLAQVEIALLEGIFVAWPILLGVSVASIGLSYVAHREIWNTAMEQAPRALRILGHLKQRHPTLFWRVLFTAGNEALADFPKGVSAEDVAFWLGRVAHGVEGMAEVTLQGVLAKATWFALLVSATHSPFIAARGVAASANDAAAELRHQLEAVGIVVSDAEASAILADLRSDPAVVGELQELQQAANALLPLLHQMQTSLYSDTH